MLNFLYHIKWFIIGVLFVPSVMVCVFFYPLYREEVQELRDGRDYITRYTESLYPLANAGHRENKKRLADQLYGLGFYKEARFLYRGLIHDAPSDDPELKEKYRACKWKLFICAGDAADNDEVDVNRINHLHLNGYKP